MRLFLTGFMGSGKTAVGERLAERLGVPFVDLDEEVEETAGRAIAEIFAVGGEAEFRRLERQALLRTAELSDAAVATGGGVVTDVRNRRWMRENGRVVWLNVELHTILARLSPEERRQRPLFRDDQAVLRLFNERLPAYADCDLEVAVSVERSVDSLAAEIADWTGRR